MSVIKKGLGFQAIAHWKGERRKQTFRTRAEAVKWHDETIDKMRRGLPVETTFPVEGKVTMRALLDMVARNEWRGKKDAAGLIRRGEQVVDLLGPSTPVDQVKKLQIDGMIAALMDEGNSDATINRKIAALSKLLTYAVEAEIIERKPTLKRRKESEHKLMWWSRDLEHRVLEWMDEQGEHDMTDYVIVSLDTGLRQGEVFRIHSDDVLPSQGPHGSLGVFGTKSGKGRYVPLTARARAILDRRLADGGLAFDGWQEWTVRTVWRRLERDIPDPMLGTPHTMRHTYGSRLAQAGVPVPHIQQLMGHANIQTTMRYVKANMDNTGPVMAALEFKEAAE